MNGCSSLSLSLFGVSFCFVFSLRSTPSLWSNLVCGVGLTMVILNDAMWGSIVTVMSTPPQNPGSGWFLHSIVRAGRLQCVGSDMSALAFPPQPPTRVLCTTDSLEWRVPEWSLSELSGPQIRLLPHSRFFKVGSGRKTPEEEHSFSPGLTSRLITQ